MISKLTQPLLVVEKLKKEYVEGGVIFPVLQDVSFQVFPNEMVAIMGPSGAGKTTLLNILAGLEPATEGKIILSGSEIHTMSDKTISLLRRTHISLVFQEFYLLPDLTAHENIEIPLVFSGLPADTRTSRVRQALKKMGMIKKEDFFPSELSGGEQQRVAIARAIVTNPSLLFVDEPTGNLDSKTGKNIISLFLEIVKSQNNSVLMVTHDPEVARRADRIFILQNGCLQDFNP